MTDRIKQEDNSEPLDSDTDLFYWTNNEPKKEVKTEKLKSESTDYESQSDDLSGEESDREKGEYERIIGKKPAEKEQPELGIDIEKASQAENCSSNPKLSLIEQKKGNSKNVNNTRSFSSICITLSLKLLNMPQLLSTLLETVASISVQNVAKVTMEEAHWTHILKELNMKICQIEDSSSTLLKQLLTNVTFAQRWCYVKEQLLRNTWDIGTMLSFQEYNEKWELNNQVNAS